jgi:hypothetical protein
MVETAHVLVVVERTRVRHLEVVHSSGQVGQRPELWGEVSRRRVQSIGWNDISTERLTRVDTAYQSRGQGIENRRNVRAREVAGAHSRRWNRRQICCALAKDESFIAEEIECAVLDYRTAVSKAKLVLAEGGPGRPDSVIEEVVRVQFAVAQEFI